MTARRTVSLPDDLAEAVDAAAGDGFSQFTQRALRNALAGRDLDLIAAHRTHQVRHTFPDRDRDVEATTETDQETDFTSGQDRPAS